MSLAVDKYLLENMQRNDDLSLMLDTDISGSTIDLLCGYNEETGLFEYNSGMMFPQPIHTVE